MQFDRFKAINRCRNYLLSADAVAFGLAYLLGGLLFCTIRAEVLAELGLSFSQLFLEWSVYLLLVTPFAIVVFWYSGHYTRRKPVWDEFREVVQGLTLLFAAEGTFLFLSKSAFSRLWLAGFAGASLVLLPLVRYAVKRLLIRRGAWQIPTVVIGTGQNAIDAIATLAMEPLLGFAVRQAYRLDPVESGAGSVLRVGSRDIPVAELGTDPVATIRKLGEPNVLFALESGGLRLNIDLLEELHRGFNDLYVVPALRGLPLYGMEINTFFRHEVLLLRLRNNLSRRMPRIIKRGFDLLLTLLLGLVLAPLCLYLAWRIRQDGGPVFYRHRRVGLGGRPFDCLKFRSMATDAEEHLSLLLARDPEAQRQWLASYKLRDDPRITVFGEFLRRTSLDELPQLWNVFKGEMSLVGPRPVMAEELTRYGRDVHYYTSVRPGMTGLWQVSGRSDADYQSRVYLDSWYVKNWAVWTDIIILLKTVGVVLGRRGAY